MLDDSDYGRQFLYCDNSIGMTPLLRAYQDAGVLEQYLRGLDYAWGIQWDAATSDTLDHMIPSLRDLWRMPLDQAWALAQAHQLDQPASASAS